MRQVFSSARVENVHAVARLLSEAGIEVRIEDGQRYRRSIRGGFSYREGAGDASRAAVWVVRSDDQPRARRLLHEAGLLEATPANPSSFLPPIGHAARAANAATPKRRMRLRFGLIIVAAVALAMWLNQFRNPGWDLPAPASAPAPAVPALDPALQAIGTTNAVHRIPVPPALAATLAAAELAAAPAPTLCLSIDGEDPGEAAQAAARAAGLSPVPASDCPAQGALHVSVTDYRTDGSGEGTVEVGTSGGGSASPPRTLQVRREGDEWRLGDTL
jgi:hypothetical protein